MFDIKFISGPEVDSERAFMWGRIVLGTFQDEFQAPLLAWTAADYERSWRRAAELLANDAPCAAFLTHMVDPAASYHIGWPVWREHHQLYVQERLFLVEQLAGPFDPERPEEHVGAREEISVEGNPISQWGVRLADISEYLSRQP